MKLVSAVILRHRVPVIIADVAMAGVLDVDSGISDSTGARPVRYWSIRSPHHSRETTDAFSITELTRPDTNCYRNLLLFEMLKFVFRIEFPVVM